MKLKYFRLGIGLILSFSLLIISLLPAYADPLEDLKKQQEQISNKIEDNQKALENSKHQEKTQLEQLQTLSSQLAALDQEIAQLEDNLVQAEEEVNQAEEELKAKISEQNDRQDKFRARLISIYEEGSVSYSEVLFQATSLTDLLTRIEYLKSIADNDTRLLKDIETERADIEQRKNELEKERDKIAALKSKREQRQNEMERQKKQEQYLLTSIQEKQDEYLKMLEQEERESNELAEKIRQLQAARRTTASRGGKMLWPTPGYSRITSEYGMRIHPILKTKRMHTGIDIAAPMGAKVIASMGGVVIYNGWYGAYGRTVIVDHGGGISTMYPHLSASLVKEDQEVRAGQKIAEVGSTGWSTGPHIHFEVRKDGDPVNPWPYLD